MNELPGSGLRVLYAVESFPHLTQTYILTEIEAMRRFGVHVEVWSSQPPLIPYVTDIPVHDGGLGRAIKSVNPHLVHTHWTHMVNGFRDVVAEAGLPLTVRGHHPYDFRREIADALQIDPVVCGVYIYSRFAARLPAGYSKILPVDACFDPSLYFVENEKDSKLVVRVAPARTVKELDLFIRVAARCPAHKFVLVAGTTAELTCPDQLRDYNRKLGNPVDLRIDASHKEIAELVRKAGIYMYTVMPGEEYSMPISVSEAMGAGCYVLNRACEGARSHLGEAGSLYENEEEAVRLISETLSWSSRQWDHEKEKSLVRAEELASPRILRPVLDDWLKIAATHSGFNVASQLQIANIDTAKFPQKRLVVVLGMHRSGTSAITRSLSVMDVSLGNNLIPPVELNNAKGFWEDVEINAINNQMLLALGTDWYRLAPIEQDDIELLNKKGYLIGAVTLLCQKTEGVTVLGLKDPRIIKLLPFWQKVIEKCKLNPSYVITLRHPLSVVKSLAQRDGLDARHGYLLWMGHVIASLSGTNGCDRVLVDYDCLMQSPEFEVNRIAKSLDFKVDPMELQVYQAEFLDENLRHTAFSLDDLMFDKACPQLVLEIYKVLLDVASDKIDIAAQELQNKIFCWAEEFERLKAPLMLADKLFSEKVSNFEQIASLHQTLVERDAELSRLNQKLVELHASTSWRVTKPIRSIKSVINGVRGGNVK
jgi:hypothetical protein